MIHSDILHLSCRFVCSFKKKRSNHRVPPPTVSEADGVNLRKQEPEERYTVTSSLRDRPAAPPLPERRAGDTAAPKTNGSVHQIISVNDQTQHGGSPVMRNNRGKKPPPITVSSRQLSQEILSTPVPISGRCVSTPQFDVDKPPLERPESEDYIEPTAIASGVAQTNGVGSQPTTTTVASPSKVSLSEEKKSDILREYFTQNSVPNLNVVVPSSTSPTSDDAEKHDYTNVVQYTDVYINPTSSPPNVTVAQHKPKQRLSREAVSPLPSPRLETQAAIGLSDSDTLKAHSRRPRPVPRPGHNSRKTSLVSETGKTVLKKIQFHWE